MFEPKKIRNNKGREEAKSIVAKKEETAHERTLDDDFVPSFITTLFGIKTQCLI